MRKSHDDNCYEIISFFICPHRSTHGDGRPRCAPAPRPRRRRAPRRSAPPSTASSRPTRTTTTSPSGGSTASSPTKSRSHAYVFAESMKSFWILILRWRIYGNRCWIKFFVNTKRQNIFVTGLTTGDRVIPREMVQDGLQFSGNGDFMTKQQTLPYILPS